MIGAAELVERRRHAAALACERGLDGLLVWGRGGTLDSFSDVHYFTNHFSPGVWVPPLPGILTGCEQAGIVIEQDGRSTLLVSDFVAEGTHVDEVRRSWDLAAELGSTIGDLGLGSSRIGVIGYEVLPFSFGELLLKAFPSIALVPADDLSAELRLRLSPAEIELMRAAGAAGSRIYRALSGAAVPGATEGEAIAAALHEAATIPGCAHWNFLASSGPHAQTLMRTSLPSWDPGQRYAQGDVVHTDCYGFVSGYAYDLARTVIVGGDPSAAQQHTIDGVEGACRAMAAQLRPGTTPRLLHQAASEALSEAGLEPVAPAFGHGIGAGFFRPYLFPVGPDLDRSLEPPLGIAFEILARDAEGNTAYHEDNYLLLESGVESVTS